MDATTILTTVLVFLGGGTVTAIVLRLLDWRKTQREGQIADAGGVETLVHKIKETMQQSLKDAATLQKVQSEKAASELLLKIKEGELGGYREMIAQILIDHGEMKERHSRCETEMENFRTRLNNYEKQLKEYPKISDQHIQMAAILKDLRLKGLWQAPPELDTITQ